MDCRWLKPTVMVKLQTTNNKQQLKPKHNNEN